MKIISSPAKIVESYSPTSPPQRLPNSTLQEHSSNSVNQTRLSAQQESEEAINKVLDEYFSKDDKR